MAAHTFAPPLPKRQMRRRPQAYGIDLGQLTRPGPAGDGAAAGLAAAVEAWMSDRLVMRNVRTLAEHGLVGAGVSGWVRHSAGRRSCCVVGAWQPWSMPLRPA